MRISNYLSFFSCLSVLLLVSPGCNKLNDLVKFKISYSSEVVVPSSLGINLPLDIITPPVSTNSESEFKSNNTNKKLVKEIYLENLDISVKSPEGRDLSFLSSLHVYINAEGLDEKLLAFNEDVPNNVGSQLSLETSGDNFKDYIAPASYSLRVVTVTDKIISDDVKLDVRSTFLVKAGVLGN